MKKLLEEIANPVNNNEWFTSELNGELKYLKDDNKSKTEIIKVLTENIDKHLPSHEEFVTIVRKKNQNSSETRRDALRSQFFFRFLQVPTQITVISW